MVWWLVACSENGLSPLPEPVVDSGEVVVDDVGAPVADAGRDREVSPLETVTLDGTASADPDGLALDRFEWTLLERPEGSTTSLDDPTTERPTFFADLAGDYVFALTVRNEAGVWDPSPATVTVTAAPLDGFYVELSWDTPTDLDLHLAEGNAALFTAKDCNYCNLNPDFGESGRVDDPSLDWDAIEGWGPETITIDAPTAGDYTVRVHFYGENGHRGDSTATVRVFLGGVEAATYRQRMAGEGSVWDVARLEWPSGQLRELNGLGRTNESFCD
jgi:hypothetical protein